MRSSATHNRLHDDSQRLLPRSGRLGPNGRNRMPVGGPVPRHHRPKSASSRRVTEYNTYDPFQTVKGHDAVAVAARDDKKSKDFGSGHPQWSPYYKPPNAVYIDRFKTVSRDIGSFAKSSDMLDLMPKFRKADAS